MSPNGPMRSRRLARGCTLRGPAQHDRSAATAWRERAGARCLIGVLGLLACCSVEGEGEGEGGPSGAPAAGAAGAPIAGSSGMPAPANPPARDQLRFLGDPALHLSTGQRIALTVELLSSEGLPVRNAAIAFDLLGRVEDSSISTLSTITDARGKAVVELRAAARPSTFTLRASNGRARSVSLAVSVTGGGLGSLWVYAPYTGPRALRERFVVALQGTRCAQASYEPGMPRAVFPPSEEWARLLALRAGGDYAVLAIAEGRDRTVLARGCIDGVEIRANTEQERSVPFVDMPLQPATTFQLHFEFEAGSAAASLASAIRAAVGAIVRTDTSGQNVPRDAEGRFWLDTLEQTLRAAPRSAARLALAEALAQERAMPTGTRPETSLSNRLQISDQGAIRAGNAAAARVRESLDRLTLTALLTVGAPEAAATTGETDESVTIILGRITGLPIREGALAPSFALASPQPLPVSAELRSDDDALHVSKLDAGLRLGALASEALRGALSVDGPGYGAELREIAGCATLAEWLAQQPYADGSSACDADCMHAVCERGIARTLDAAEAQLADLDERRPVAVFRGTFSLHDTDGDLIAEQLSAEPFDGSWLPAEGASLSDTLRGSVVGTTAAAVWSD